MQHPAISTAAAAVLLTTTASAVNEKGDWPWNEKLHGWQDAEVAEELGTGWFMNVGPTGIRAQITHDHPKFLTVKYVFKKSPASKLVSIGDIIVGANDTRLTVEHRFGRRKVTGWDGPMLDMSKLIEDSQGKEGKLELIIWPGGIERDEKTVTVQIDPVGRFSPTWPFDCPRSDRLLTSLCDYMVDEYKRAGSFEKRVHTHSACVLALMASGDEKYHQLVKQIMSGYSDKRYSSTNAVGFPAWNHVHDGIVMGEYYLLTKDRRLLEPIESLATCIRDSVWPQTGGLSHRPFAAIQRRMAAGGPKGYGAMAMPGGLGMLALSLFKEAGLPHAEPAYKRLHQAYLDSVSPSGAIGYGFNSWDHAVIELADPKGAPENSPDGIGFECLDGMQGIGDYKIIWPTRADPRFKPTGWLDNERATNRVFDRGGGSRLVVRTMAPDEPTRPYQQDGRSCDHHGRSGVGALAHAIGNGDSKSWGYLSDLMATGCAKSGKGLLDGHASTHMHVLWGSLGAARADAEDFREYLDHIRWWMVMAQAHDGSYVVMPGRDYASTDHVYATRNFPSACAALILAVKEKRLQITGAPQRDGTASPATSTPRLSLQQQQRLGDALVASLATLSQSGQLQPLPMTLSKATSRVKLVAADPAGNLTFQALVGDNRAQFAFADLTTTDHTLLARIVARLQPRNLEAQARAGLYLEEQGQPEIARHYYDKAGTETKQQVEDSL